MKKMHVYSHTHWDYEWYFTANESIIQLIYHMDEVITALEEGILTHYLLDSQVSILEEYLQFMPQKQKVVEKLVESGKLMIGPWYTQSDELIISGESLARNLWYGMNYAQQLGRCMKIGYLPDSFGQSKDMPKLYQGFGIRDVLFWRGVPSDVCERREFMWRSSDGSEVLAYNIRDGYFYGGNLIYTDDVDRIEERFLDKAVSRNQLFPVGGDQRYVDFNLQERLQYYNEHTSHGIEYVESDLETFYRELREEGDLPVIEGEFIDASVSKIHHSIYSSRYDHKVLNDAVERRLLYQLEPFMVMQQQMGVSPKVTVLERLWKKFLLNHAHDSACGCNSDQTNRSILQRLTDCDQMSSMMLDYQVRKTSESLEGIMDQDLVLYNTLPYTRMITQEITLSTPFRNFHILDEDGKTMVMDVLSTQREYSGSIRKDTGTYQEELYYYKTTVRIQKTMEPMSLCICHIEETEEMKELEVRNSRQIENSRYRISLQDGILTLFDKERNKELTNFLYIEDGGDDGDTYDYSYPEHDRIYELNFTQATCKTCEGQLGSVMTLYGVWELPYQLNDRECGHAVVGVPYELDLRLDHSSLIQCELKIHNRVLEHRMRVILRSDISCTTAIADTLFGTIERENTPEHMKDWKERGYREEPTPIYPMLHHVTMKDKQSTTLYSLGIREYEILEEGRAALTLFRSVGYLGKPDLERRPGIASGNEFQYIETPDSQLLQELNFSFAISYDKEYDALQIQKNWLFYASDILYYQMQEMNRFVNTQKYFVTHPYAKPLKPCSSYLNLDELQHAVFSSLQPLDETSSALRIWNTRLDTCEEGCLTLGEGTAITETNFLHEEMQPLEINTYKATIGKLSPEAMKTYKITTK